MTAIEQIKAAQHASLADKAGKLTAFELAPALTPEQISSVEDRVGQPLPEELRVLLGFCSGIDGGRAEIDFTGERMAFEYKEIFPHGLAIAHDGCGNFWVLDITPATRQTAPVFLACHDAPVILYQSPDVASFMSGLLRPTRSSFDDVYEDRVYNVWQKNPGVIHHAAALGSPDTAIQSFASGLSDNFQIIDLRNVDAGMGFSWGRFGPQTEVRRHGYERIFAYAHPARRGFFGKLFGR